MANITTRAGKGSELTHGEVDANFVGLNDEKAPLASPTFTGTVSGITAAMVGLGNVPNLAFSGSNTGDQIIPTTLPASDVYAWAKAATKPSYTAAEVGAQNVLVSGTNIRTVNGNTLLGSTDLVIASAGYLDGGVPTSTYGGITSIDGGTV